MSEEERDDEMSSPRFGKLVQEVSAVVRRVVEEDPSLFPAVAAHMQVLRSIANLRGIMRGLSPEQRGAMRVIEEAISVASAAIVQPAGRPEEGVLD